MLTALYTDSSAHSIVGKCARSIGEIAPASIQRLGNRIITGIPEKKIFSTDYPMISSFAQKITSRNISNLNRNLTRGKILSKKMISWGTRNADAVYSMNRSNLDFIHYAKQQGCRSVIDVFIGPQTESIMLEEHKAFPTWGHPPYLSDASLSKDLWEEMASTADILTCPSNWVAEGVKNLLPAASDKIRIVPYGCSFDYHDCRNKPIKGRVLFAGGDALRKGLHYLAQSATELVNDIPELDVRVAGRLQETVIQHPSCKNLNFLGKLSAKQMKEEYLSADLLALPSLSEGFSSVIAEAIGAGCPVVVTKEAGSPIIHEREGLIIPSRNTKALSESIKIVIEDRNLRMHLSDACLAQAPYYTEREWGKRLVHALT